MFLTDNQEKKHKAKEQSKVSEKAFITPKHKKSL